MNERRQRAAARFVRFIHTHSGKLYLSEESVVRLCRDAALLPHELDRAIDDLFGLGAIEVSAPDDLAHVVKLIVLPSRIAWRVPGFTKV